MSTHHVTRRTAVTGVAGVGAGAVFLASCSSDDSGSASDQAPSSPSDASSDPSAEATTGAGAALAATADIPVGGCAVFADQKVVVTQPTEGDFKAFSSVCTHQACTVSASTDGVIPCGCHGSEFSIEDGSVIQGPATAALAEVPITVDGDSITLA